MPHVQPGDLIFFRPTRVLSKLNTLGQTMLTRRRSRWSHVALCINGPLIIHATPRHKDLPLIRGAWLALTGNGAAGAPANPGAREGGVHLELLGREYLSRATFTVMRPILAASQPDFAERLQEAATYWLAQQYSFASVYLKSRRSHRPVSPGQSFCSFLVQQVCARVGLSMFGALKTAAGNALMPGELFDLLSTDASHWQWVESVSLEGSDAEQQLIDLIWERSSNPQVDVTGHLAPYKMTMATILVVARGRIAQIEYVQSVNRLFDTLHTIRRDFESALKLLPPADRQAFLENVQPQIASVIAGIERVMDTSETPADDRLFMNYRSLVSIVVQPKGTGTVDLENHWVATRGGARLEAPDEDFVDSYLASQRTFVETLHLRQLGVPLPPLDSRWDLPTDRAVALAAIQDDMRRLDACELPDWRDQRTQLRTLLVQMQDVLAAESST